MPTLQREHALGRIRQLLADKDASELDKLFEARLFHSMQLVTDDELSKIYQIALRGNEGLALATGTPEDRKLVLDEVVSE